MGAIIITFIIIRTIFAILILRDQLDLFPILITLLVDFRRTRRQIVVCHGAMVPVGIAALSHPQDILDEGQD